MTTMQIFPKDLVRYIANSASNETVKAMKGISRNYRTSLSKEQYATLKIAYLLTARVSLLQSSLSHFNLPDLPDFFRVLTEPTAKESEILKGKTPTTHISDENVSKIKIIGLERFLVKTGSRIGVILSSQNQGFQKSLKFHAYTHPTALIPESDLQVLQNLNSFQEAKDSICIASRLTKIIPKGKALDSLQLILGNKEDSNINKSAKITIWANQNKSILSDIKKMRLSRMDIISLPSWFQHCINLETLWLSQNRLQFLPSWMGTFSKLKHLDLNHNQIEKLPHDFYRLTQLQTLSLNHNKLKKLHPELRNFTQMTLLYLNGNRLKKLPLSIGSLEIRSATRLAK